MADIKFGTAQISNPTPSKINLWVRVFTVAAAIFLGWMPTSNMGPHSKENISQVLGLLLLLTNGLAPLFGIDIQSRMVSSDKVTAIDETK